jgi:hypothetical protein
MDPEFSSVGTNVRNRYEFCEAYGNILLLTETVKPSIRNVIEINRKALYIGIRTNGQKTVTVLNVFFHFMDFFL